MAVERNGVFISHLTQESPVAAVLQKYIKLAFGDDFRAFVSSDKVSIGGGEKWFNHIIEHLRMSSIIIVLVSQESKRTEWTNFEAGFGDGGFCRVIPVSIRNFPLSQLSYPLAGYQGRSIDDIGYLLNDIGVAVGATPSKIDVDAYLEEMKNAEAKVNYKALRLNLHADETSIKMAIENVGNVDLELLMLELYVPSKLLDTSNLSFSSSLVERHKTLRDNEPYDWFAMYSPKGAYAAYSAALRPVITPSMGEVFIKYMTIPLPNATGTQEEFWKLFIHYQIHAVGYNTSLESIQFIKVRRYVL